MIASNRVPGSGVNISRLGFGCVRLTSRDDEKAALRTLETAFECGITHFDTARIYGLGHSERILGKFLQDKRASVTVATKFGFAPSKTILNQRFLIKSIKTVLAPFPALLARADKFGRGTAVATSAIPRGTFDLQRTKESLDQSLRALRTDYIDVFMMHEATIEDAQSEELLQFLKALVDKGTIRSFGVASDFDKLGSDATRFDPGCRVLQFNHSATDPKVDAIANTADRFIITFQHLAPMRALRVKFEAEPNLARTLSGQLGVDVTVPENIADVLQQYAFKTNSAGAILFSSTSPKNIRSNVRHAEQSRFSIEQLDAFALAVQSGRSLPLHIKP